MENKTRTKYTEQENKTRNILLHIETKLTLLVGIPNKTPSCHDLISSIHKHQLSVHYRLIFSTPELICDSLLINLEGAKFSSTSCPQAHESGLRLHFFVFDLHSLDPHSDSGCKLSIIIFSRPFRVPRKILGRSHLVHFYHQTQYARSV